MIGLLLTCFIVLANAQETLVRTKINSDISIKVPDSFVPMEPEMIIRKYITAKQPIAMFTSADARADLGINMNRTHWGADDVQMLRDFYKSNLYGIYSGVEIIQDTIVEIDSRKVILLEFLGTVEESNAIGDQVSMTKYNYLAYTTYQGKVLLVNFNSPVRDRQYWKPTVDEIMQSIRLR